MVRALPPRHEGPHGDTIYRPNNVSPSDPSLCIGAPDESPQTAVAAPSQAPCDTKRSVFQRILDYVRRGFRRKQSKDSPFDRDLTVCINVGNDEIRRTVDAKFDTQCPVDIISTGCLRDTFPEVQYHQTAEQRLGTSITGREEYVSIGTVDIRWHGRNNKDFARIQFRPRYELSTCYVVESDRFEIFIGRCTIDRLQLFRHNNSIIAGIRPVPPAPDIKKVQQDQRIAEASREQADNLKRQRESSKKEKEKSLKK